MPAVALVLAACTVVAVAFWTTSGAGTASATSGSLAAAEINAATAGSPAVTVTWDQQAALVPSSAEDSAITYSVERQLDSGSFVAVAGGDCSGAVSHGTASCVDSPAASGSYSYRVVATYATWTATSDAAGPVSVSLDADGPSGGSVDASGLAGAGGRYSTSAALSIVLDKGTDPAGFASSGAELRRSTATLSSAGSCGSYDASVQIGADDPVSPVANSVSAGEACYRYDYVVQDTVGNSTTYTSPDIKVDTVAPASPTVVALTNGGGAGSAYINAANKASVDFSVTLASSSSSSNTIALSIADAGSAHVLTPTTAATSGAGSVAFNGRVLTTFDDGTITVGATASDLAGNSSAATTITPTKDTAAPASPTVVTLTNGGGAGSAYINAANKASVDFSVTLAASSSSSNTVNFSIADAGFAHVLTPTTAATSGAGSVTFNGRVLTTFDDGTITVGATASDVAGNSSSATTITPTKDTTAADPTAVTLTNGAGTANAYINTANKASVNFSVTLAASSSSSDTVNFSIADAGSAHVLSPTTAATSGAGSVTFNAQILTAFNDGTITVGATSTDLAGNTSTATIITPTKDTAAPADPTAVSLTNGAGAGSAYINAANKASVDFSVTLAASSSSSNTIALNIADAGSAHVLTPTTGATSGAGSVAFNGRVLTAFNDGTITVGATAVDLAGNSSSATTITPTKDTAAPADPTAVTMTNGAGAGSAYVSNANRFSVGYSVVNVGNAAGDTIRVTLTSSGGGSSASGSTVRGPSSPTAVSLNASSPADGTVTATTKATDAAGNDSAGTATTTAPKDTVPSANPTSVTLTNGGGTGSAYINAANSASVNFSVTVGASSVSSDTVKLNIFDPGNAHVLAPTTPAPSGAGTVTFNGQVLTAFNEGGINAQAYSIDIAGNTSLFSGIFPTKDTVAAANPTAVTLSNGGGVGSAYINTVNRASVGYSVVNASNVAADSISVTLTSSGGGSPASGSTVRGASSPTAVSVNAGSSPADGTITATAKATDAAGNDSAGTATTTGPKETVAPTATDIQTTAVGGTVGKPEAGDKTLYTFSEPMNPASLKSGWNGTSTPLTSASITSITGPPAKNQMTLVTANFGQVDAPLAGYVTGTVNFLNSTIVLSGSVVTLTFVGSPTTTTAPGTCNLVWNPSASATDVAGNAMSTTPRTGTGAAKKQW